MLACCFGEGVGHPGDVVGDDTGAGGAVGGFARGIAPATGEVGAFM